MMFLQYPLNADDYKSLLEEFEEIVEAHTKSIGTLPKAQLDPLDLTGKIAPCCNHDDDCTCSTAAAPVPSADGTARNKYGPVPSDYHTRWL